jgi:hypothetical protein
VIKEFLTLERLDNKNSVVGIKFLQWTSIVGFLWTVLFFIWNVAFKFIGSLLAVFVVILNC